jgi:hypothetical protein
MADKMTQVKFTLETEIISAFKKRCAAGGVSMASEIRKYMISFRPVKEPVLKIHNRKLRKNSVLSIIGLLSDILIAEEDYRDRIPEQFTSRYDAADHACAQLSEAIAYLEEAF